MADKNDIFYRPDIQPPERERNPSLGPVNDLRYDEDYSAETGILPDIPREDRPDDAYSALIKRFETLETKGVELRKRADFLMDRTIEDIDGYIGDAPDHILAYVQDLTGRTFTHVVDNVRVPKPITDEIYTLNGCEMKCIFRAAGFYNPGEPDNSISKEIIDSKFDASWIRLILEKKKRDKNMQLKSFGAKLLIIVLKMSYVIMVHYTVGYVCGWLKQNSMIRTGLDIMSTFFGTPALGTITWQATQLIERLLLAFVGFGCNPNPDKPVICDFDGWQDTEIRFITCCTMSPIFFGQPDPTTGKIKIELDVCFEHWVQQELDAAGMGGRTICNLKNCPDGSIKPTADESVKAEEVTKYLLERPSKNGVMNPSDIHPLSKAMYNADAGVIMAKQSQSAIKTARDYLYTGKRNGPWDCFGYTIGTDDIEETILEGISQTQNNVNKASGRWMEPGNTNTSVQKSIFTFDFFKKMDQAVTKALEFSDKVVIGVSNLAKWSASKQLCCYVYLIVLVSSLIHSLITKGTVCTGMDIGEAVREEIRWAKDLRGNASIQMLVQILKVIKQVIDVFRKRMNRELLLSGLKLPLREMFEDIKVVLANGLAGYLDIILGPIDQVLAGIKGMPEVRNMINSECFQIDKLFSFLQCMVGNLKFGIINWVMQFMDKTLNDFTLIDDMYLSRTKMAFLDALSDLLDKMVNLILSIRDCYDPSDLSNQLVDKQMEDEYYKLQKYYEVMVKPEFVKYMDQCSTSIMNQSFIPTEDRRADIAALDGGLTKMINDLGLTDFPEKLLIDSLTQQGHVIDLEQFSTTAKTSIEIGESMGTDFVEAISFGEFVKLMEDQTGVKATETKESLRYIFDILRGQESTSS